MQTSPLPWDHRPRAAARTSPIIPFGPSYRAEPKAERGLLFICCQASIADQFEFLWRVWANKTGTPRAHAGIDPSS